MRATFLPPIILFVGVVATLFAEISLLKKEKLHPGLSVPLMSNAFPAKTFSVLTPDEAKTLAAIADRIFPETDTPGAVQIGALDYIDIALGGAYAEFTPLYRQGLRFIDRHARKRFAARFADLANETKDALLAEFEAGTMAGFKRAAEFFEMVRYHVLEGVFCEPQYGGNKDMSGWRLVGFPGQQFGYPDAYINRRVDLEPIAVESDKAMKK